ncbi:MAG: serine/threonine-protein phosphatase [Phycisphaerales bacterium]|nr:MAG: serine/threonine-protein phosphatase [Phycisphaerales bacterium]
MKNRPATSPFDEEISVASEQKRGEWIHRRLLIYCKFSIFQFTLETVIRLTILVFRHGSFVQNFLASATSDLLPPVVGVIIFLSGYKYAKNRPLDRVAVIRYSFRMIFLVGIMGFVIRPLFADAPVPLVGRVLVIHLVGALFIPWTVREAFKILLGLCGLALISDFLFVEGTLGHRVFEVFILPAMGLPGLLWCWFRYSRFHSRFTLDHVLGRYGQLQRELEQARSVHEMLFPNEITEGPFQLRYRYEPMQQLGGDYVYVHRDQGDRLNIVVLDVTGHGITAALTVNRIHGELDRLFGENDDRRPGDVLKALNRYFCVSMARHGVYATAVAVRIDRQGDQLEWANAGHPPPFVLCGESPCVALDSNAVMLGVLDDPLYECSTQVQTFADGDRIVLYTDGVIEAHDSRNEMLGIDGFQRVLQGKASVASREAVSEDLLREVQRFRKGPAEDDVLIVELSRHGDRAEDRKGEIHATE